MKITDRQLDYIRTHIGSVNDKEIADRLGVTHAMVRYYRKKVGVPRARHYYWDEDKVMEFCDMWREHHDLEAIAERFGVKAVTLHTTCSRLRKVGYDIPTLKTA